MCGITGFWRLKGLKDGEGELLQNMIARLHHRGPDGRGRHLDQARGLAMGHARLSIIDLSDGGAQPLFDQDRQTVLTVNGEFYDYKTQRARLACDGERFQTKTDSEVALKLYRRHGLDFVHHLRGEFALALFDAEKRRMILVRDRFGVRPLFFHLKRDALFWGSEAKALFAHPDVPRALDERAALHQMMHTLVPGMTAFRDIGALKPGHMMVVEDGGTHFDVATHKYWDMDFPLATEHDKNPDPDLYVRGVRETLVDAVRVRLEADVPVGCYLSGGIDSCSILGLSTAMQQSPVKAYTISFDHDAYDEATIAREMALSTGADQEVLRLSADELYGEHYVRSLWHAERTFYNTLGVAKYHMSRRVRDSGFKVVVTGEGSDEMFAGYPFFKRDYFLHAPEARENGSLLGAQMEASNGVFKGAILAEQAVRHPAMEELCGFTPSWIQPWVLTLSRVRPLFGARAGEALAGYDPILALAEALDPAQLRGRHPLDKVQYTWIKTMLECQILNWGGDRVDMAHSMESRPPFLDHQLAAFARTVPPGLRIRNGVEKWVLREAMRGVLPSVLYKREKFAFMAPPSHTDQRKRQAVKRLATERLGPEQVETAGLFDPGQVEAFLRQQAQATDDAAEAARNDIILNHLLGLHILHQELVLA